MDQGASTRHTPGIPDISSTEWLSPAYVPDLVSVIVPTFNRAALTLELLDNLAAQHWPTLEVVVIDDGSTDDTCAAVRGWIADHPAPAPTVCLLSQSNAGPAAARNRGFSAAQGEFLYCIDSDDLIYPAAIADMVGAIRTSGRPYCLAQVWISGIDGVADVTNGAGQPRQSPDNILACGWMTHGALYRRSAVAQAGPYIEQLRIGEDTEFHWRIAAMNGPGHVLDQSVGVRREHGFGHLSIDRSEQELCQNSIAAYRVFLRWAVAEGKMTTAIGNTMARACLIAGIKLGYIGDWPTKAVAFEVIAATGGQGPRWNAIATTLGQPNRRSYFGPYRLALWCAKQTRNAANSLQIRASRLRYPTEVAPPPAMRIT